MKCVKCGAELEEGAKFCGNCGSTVEADSAVEEVKEETVEEAKEETVAVEFPTEVSTESQVERQEIVQEPIPVDTPEFKKQQAEGKKSAGAVKIILVIISIIAILAIVAVAIFKLKDNKNEAYNESINTVQKSIENFAKDANLSGTIKAKVEIDIKDSMSAKLGATFEYEKVDEAYKMHIGIDENAFIGKMDAYVDIAEEEATIYIPASIIKLIDSSMDLGSSIKWLKYTMDPEELGISDLDTKTEVSNEELDLSKVLTSDSFKYVGKKGDLKQYTLTIDKKYMNSIEELKEYAEEIGDMKIDVDFYIDSTDRLQKVEMDLAAAMKEKAEGINKFLLTIEFSNYNSTKVTIPSDVIKSSVDITTLMEDEDLTSSLPTPSLF